MKDQFALTLGHPILRGHTVSGRHVLPGLAYVDLVYQWFRARGHAPVDLELRHLVIYQPLIVAEAESRLCEIEATEEVTGTWQLEMRSQPAGDSHGQKTRHASASVCLVQPTIVEETIDLAQIARSATRVIDMEEVYGELRARGLNHSGVMQAEGVLYVTATAAYADIGLTPSALKHAGDVLFHPALLDAAAACAGVVLSARDDPSERRLLLPICYEAFRASAMLQRRCLVRIRIDSFERKRHVRRFTLEFFDASGRKVAELVDIACTVLREPGLIDGHTDESTVVPVPSMVTSAAPAPVTHPLASESGPTAVAADIEFFIRRSIAERLQRPVDDIDPNVGYYEMGLNSQALLEVVRALDRAFGVTLSPTLLFEFPTAAELTTFLVETHGQRFRTTFDDGADRLSTTSDVAMQTVLAPTAETKPPLVETASADPASARGDDVAVIGMAGRFPRARNISEFWRNLESGLDCVTEIPPERWSQDVLVGARSPSGKPISRWGGFIDGPECFDARFFRVSPREAETLDPQERLFLEVCWEAVEDAGYTPATLSAHDEDDGRRRVGVFVGVMHKDYALVGAEALFRGERVPLSLNYAPIANRVSYFCNFHGPSLAVDTVCSSSLTAVHLAIQSIRCGESTVAIAGGVNLSLHPGKYLSYGLSDMHSTDGRCRAFGRDGDGYVPGECVGAVVLKPLPRAVEDGDHIYATIKGSCVNHGGTVGGITVPSPVAQAAVIADCLTATGIDPRTIGYVEAHGTGTALGDPIEIEGLARAYRRYTADAQFCSIGSVKTNIGHAEGAAGIAGLIKVALQLERKTLVASLHAENLNPYVDWARSPFRVQQRTEAWAASRAVEDDPDTEQPRRAALSAFGATGSNCHLVLQEHHVESLNAATRRTAPRDVHVILVSAQNFDRLLVYVTRLLEFIETGQPDLTRVAYTLQVGRESLSSRVAFIVRGLPELVQKLGAFVRQERPNDAPRQWLHGEVKRGSDAIGLLSPDEDSRQLVETWLTKGKVTKLAEFWVSGGTVDWRRLYGEGCPRRMSVPTYPFARERYWLARGAAGGAVEGAAGRLHPLVHVNTSGFEGPRFSARFTGEEFFLADHVVKGVRVLPAVAYLEMARVAVEQAGGFADAADAAAAGEQAVLRLQDVVWAQPLVVGATGVTVQIALQDEGNGSISYEIAQATEAGPDAALVVHAQGTAVLVRVPVAAPVALAQLQAACPEPAVPGAQCYAVYEEMGLAYGAAFRGIERLRVGCDEAGHRFVLGEVTLPGVVAATQTAYGLHPSVLDSALQVGLGLIEGALAAERPRREPLRPRLPFALERLEVCGPCPAHVWVYVREADDSTERVRRVDVDLCDDAGIVSVRVRGLAARVLEGISPCPYPPPP